MKRAFEKGYVCAGGRGWYGRGREARTRDFVFVREMSSIKPPRSSASHLDTHTSLHPPLSRQSNIRLSSPVSRSGSASTSQSSAMKSGRTPVSDKFKRMRFTLRHRTGGGAEGAAKIMEAFAKYDTHGTKGTVTKAEFTQALKNLNVTLSEDQLRVAAEDCVAPSSDPRFARVDYALFLTRCFPDEAEELGVRSLEDRRIQAAMTQVEGMHLGGGSSRVQWREGSAGDGTLVEYAGGGGEEGGGVGRASGDPAGSPSGMSRHGKDGFMRNSTDVTFVSMDGLPCKKIPTELSREPPLNIFHGRGMEKPARPLESVPLHEQALQALRLKLKQRVSIRNSGTGFYTLKKTLLTPFVDPPPALTLPMFRRALIAMNFNMTEAHAEALFSVHANADDEVRVDDFCRQVVQGASNAEYTGGAPPEYDVRKEGPFKTPERHHLNSTDVTFVSLDGVPCKRLPTELAHEPPLNVLDAGFKMERRAGGFFDDAEESAMRVLREKIKQRVSIKNSGNGAFLLKKSLVKHSGADALSRGEFLFAIELMGLNLPEQMYVTLYERNCDRAGMVDVEAFCKKVVTY